MRAEIDQNGRVEKLNTSTVVACANGTTRVLFITAGEKRKVIQYLKHQQSFQFDFAPIFFAVLVFLLLKNKTVTTVLIDEEYTGKESIIEAKINQLLRQTKLQKFTIRFSRIGKHSRAHLVAWQAHRDKGRFPKIIKISAKEVISLLEAKK